MLLTRALHQPKIRKPTKVSKAAREARLQVKRINSTKKENRKGNFEEWLKHVGVQITATPS